MLKQKTLNIFLIIVIAAFFFVGKYFITKLTSTDFLGESSENSKSLTVISPARDLTGEWEGTFRWKSEWSQDCSYEMVYLLSLTQNGNSLSGALGPSGTTTTSGKVNGGPECLTPFQVAIIDPFIDGTVSATTFEITAYDTVLSGTFTSDLMQGTISGPYTGDFSLRRK